MKPLAGEVITDMPDESGDDLSKDPSALAASEHDSVRVLHIANIARNNVACSARLAYNHSDGTGLRG